MSHKTLFNGVQKTIVITSLLLITIPHLTLASEECYCPCECESTPEEQTEYSQAIIINEILPNPSGTESSEEFIELHNISAEAVDLTGWYLSDATSKVYELDNSISANGYVVVYREESSIALNNGGDTVQLYQPDDSLLEEIEYIESAEEDVVYALNDSNEWQWSLTATPGRSNVISEMDSNEETETDSSEKDVAEDEEIISYEYSEDIKLSELLPDPEGSDATDEWIEIVNQGSKTINLQGWQLADSSKTYTINDSLEVTSNEYYTFLVTETGISLNNSGETVYLLDPANETMDEIEYEKANTGESYAKLNDEWFWTSVLTPNEANVISETEEISEEVINIDVVIDEEQNTANEVSVYSLLAAKQLPKGEEVIVQGVVNSLPDTFSSQYFYIQEETSGLQIYSSKKLFPELNLGDQIQVTGKMSEAKGEKKLNISSADDISSISNSNELNSLEINEYIEDNLGKLVTVQGEVLEKSGSTITLDNDWQIYIKRATGISTKSFITGEHITITGVLTATNDGIRILPRSENDITKITQEALAESKDTSSSLIKAAHAQSNETYSLDSTEDTKKPNSIIWLGILLAVVICLILLSRSENLKNLLRNRLSQWVRDLASRLDQSVE